MMRTPRHLDPYAPELTGIWRAGWGIRHYRTPVGVFIRLEKGLFFRGGNLGRWHWAPTTKAALQWAASMAAEHPFPTPLPATSVYDDAEWEDEA